MGHVIVGYSRTFTIPPTGITTATDTFNRADSPSSLGTADSGQVWATSGIWSILSNLAKSSGASNTEARLECYSPDLTVSVVMAVMGNNVGLLARHNGGGAFLKIIFSSGSVNLIEHNPSDTIIGTSAWTANNGDVLKVELAGSSVKVYVNNTLLITATSTLNQFNGTRAGLISNADATARFNDFNAVLPVPIDVTDDFNRADAATLGTASDGVHTWFSLTGNHGIQTNRARNPVGSANLFTAVVSNSPNCTIQVTLPINLNGTSIGFRATDGSNFLFAGWSGGNLVLVKKVANANTTIASASPTVAPANGQVLKVVLSGSSIEVYVDNVLKISATETFNQLGTLHGVYSSFGSSTYRYDDFSITT